MKMKLDEGKNPQFYALGRVFRLLMDAAKERGANQADYQNAMLNPANSLAYGMKAVLSAHKLTPEINDIVAMLLEDVELDTLIEYSNRTIPQDLKFAWQLGYENGSKYSFSKSKLEAIRKEKKLTQKQLAELVGCTQKDISRWETKIVKPGIDKLKMLSTALECEVNDLVD